MTTILWLGVILLCLLMYVILDGYDLGIGIASLFERDPHRRGLLLESVATAWDGNETWLILLGVSLWAGFPLAFGTVLPHAYLPLVVMLFSLIVRGVSVELASQRPSARGWNRLFAWASLSAAFAQGFAFATLAEPLQLTADDAFTGTTFGAFSWFGVLAGAATVAGYTALGYAHVTRKFVGELHGTAVRGGIISTLATGVLVIGVLVAINATAAPLNLTTGGRVAAFVGLLLFVLAGIVIAVLSFARTGRAGWSDDLPFAALSVSTVGVFLALLVTHYPVLAPPDLTFDRAAGPHSTMVFLLVGVGLNIPLVLGYTVFAHRAFNGKLNAEPTPAAVTSTREGQHT